MEQQNTPRMNARGFFLALTAVVVWAGNFVVARDVAEFVPPYTLSAARWAISFLVFAPFALRDFRREWPLVRKHMPYLFVLSFLGLGFFSGALYLAAHSTEALNMALFSTTSPIFTLLLAYLFLREPLGLNRITGIVAAFAGVLILTVRGDFTALGSLNFYFGDVLVLASALSFAGYTVLLRFKPADLGENSLSLATFILAFIMLLPFSLWELASGAEVIITAKSSLEVLYIALGASLVSYWCWNKATASIGASNAAVIYYSIPLFSGVMAMVFLHEPVLGMHFISGALILAGIFVATRR